MKDNYNIKKYNSNNSDQLVLQCTYESSKKEETIEDFNPKYQIIEYNEYTELRRIKEETNKLRKEVDELRLKLGGNDEHIVFIREINRNQAKKEIDEFIKTNKTTDLIDIQNKLGIDLELIVDIVKELNKEGKVKLDADD